MREKECKVTSMAAIVARVLLAGFRGRNEQSVRVRENVLVLFASISSVFYGFML